MGKDRRKKDVGNRQTTPTPNEVESEPKGQRAARVRAHQRDSTRNTKAPVKETATVDPPAPQPQEEKKSEPINTAALFANLKRETDDIKALTVKKYSKRQIFSNWERYEEPAPEPQYEIEMQGADFESLLQAPDTSAGHFQFKSEKTWDANVSALSGELFSLDIDLLVDGLATIPLYKKLDIPITLFSADVIEDMDYIAASALKQYEATKKNIQNRNNKKESVKSTTDRILGLLMDKELSPAPVEKTMPEEKADLNFDIDQPEIQNDVIDSDADVKAYLIKTESDRLPSDTVMPAVDTKVDIRQSPPPKSVSKDIEKGHRITNKPEDMSKNILERVLTTPEAEEENLFHREERKESSSYQEAVKEYQPARNFKKGNQEITRVMEVTKESTPPRNNKQIMKEITPVHETEKENSQVEINIKKPEQEMQQSQLNSPENVFEEPVVPLGQRSGRRKAKNHAQISGNQSRVPESLVRTEIPGNQNNPQIAENLNRTQLPEKQSKAKIPEKLKGAQIAEKPKKPHVSEKGGMDYPPDSGKKAEIPGSQSKSHGEKQIRLQQDKPHVSEKGGMDYPPDSGKKAQIPGSQSKSHGEKQIRLQQDKPQSQPKQVMSQLPEDDLDFLLSLKKPVRETQISSLQQSQAAKPSIDEEDAEPDPSQLTLVSPHKTEDLEDWLDSMLDD